jgi:chromosome condensin MukBEF complex kleisin-like MukF subunit
LTYAKPTYSRSKHFEIAEIRTAPVARIRLAEKDNTDAITAEAKAVATENANTDAIIA